MEQIISPIALYLVCALGAGGIALALPRHGLAHTKDKAFQYGGAVIVAAAFGFAALLFGMKATSDGYSLPNLFFYPFAFVAIGAAVRMITHKRPVYSALYFIMTILGSCGMYILLSAEFMAFALVIIYAGAILITYLFVIMLASQAPTGQDDDELPEVDTVAREPMLACAIGFVMVGLITAAMFGGIGQLPEPVMTQAQAQNGVLVHLPKKVDKVLDRAGLLEDGWRVSRDPETGLAMLDADARTIQIELVGQDAHGHDSVLARRTLTDEDWPETLAGDNLDRLGFNLLNDHPMMIEVAGIILLMAMLGATVLARKHTELEEALKAAQARKLGTMFDDDGQPSGGHA